MKKMKEMLYLLCFGTVVVDLRVIVFSPDFCWWYLGLVPFPSFFLYMAVYILISAVCFFVYRFWEIFFVLLCFCVRVWLLFVFFGCVCVCV